MAVSRRGFIVSTAAFAALERLPIFAAGKRDLSNPDLKLGVISDVHIRNAGDEKTVADVLRWYRNNLVDAVVVAGDIADYGLTWQMDAFAGAWEEVFPAGRVAKSGRKVELILVTGNHEFDIWKRILHVYPNPNELEERVFVKHIEREWKRIFREEYAPAYVKTVKGYPFFCINFLSWEPSAHLKAVRELYARAAASIPKNRPFFHVQHCHPKGTCGLNPGMPDALTAHLSQYPNLVCFSGHSHYSLEDDKSFWRGAFTSVNTATLQHVWSAGKAEKIRNFPQGLLVRVWPDFVHVERRNFRDGTRFDPAWESEMEMENGK